MEKGAIAYHAILDARVKLIRQLKSRRPGFWTVEILDGPRAGQWYDADPVCLSPAR